MRIRPRSSEVGVLALGYDLWGSAWLLHAPGMVFMADELKSPRRRRPVSCDGWARLLLLTLAALILLREIADAAPGRSSPACTWSGKTIAA